MPKALLGSTTDPVLGNCWLWLRSTGRPRWCPLLAHLDHVAVHGRRRRATTHTVSGIGRCNRDRFLGDEAGLRNLWLG